MSYPVIHACPVCQNTLHIKKLACPNCHTTIENDFELSKLSSLSGEQIHFVEVFLASRGNIKEVEKELGVSYPTVRSKLNNIITQLGYGHQSAEANKQHQSDIIEMLDNGEITAKEANKLLKKD